MYVRAQSQINPIIYKYKYIYIYRHIELHTYIFTYVHVNDACIQYTFNSEYVCA